MIRGTYKTTCFSSCLAGLFFLILFHSDLHAGHVVLSGIVTDRDSIPIAGAGVKCITSTDSIIDDVTTDSEGKFILRFDMTGIISETSQKTLYPLHFGDGSLAVIPVNFGEAFRAELFSLNGKVVAAASSLQKNSTAHPVINRTNASLSNGIYILRVFNAERTFTARVILRNNRYPFAVSGSAGLKKSKAAASSGFTLRIEYPDYVPVDYSTTAPAENLHIILNKKVSSPELTAWLDAHPEIAGKIIWHSEKDTAWPDWTENQKNDLRAAYNAFRWGTSGGLPDAPPISRYFPTPVLDVDYILYAHRVAWTFYIHYLAQTLAVEIKNIVPWSITDYTEEELKQLLDSRTLFEWYSPQKLYAIVINYLYREMTYHGAATPGDPGRIAAFLDTNNYIGTTQHETIVNLFDWSRNNLTHFSGGFDTANLSMHWGYTGFPPVERVIAGTVSEAHPFKLFRHWTAGCWGTCAFLRILLRTVNIPAVIVRTGGHALPYFISDHSYLSHGDDLYSTLIRATPPIPSEELFISEATYNAWFSGKKTAEQLEFVSRRPYELAVKYISDGLVENYCQDVKSGTDHAGSSVFATLSGHFTLEELEADSLWQRIEKKAASLGKCF